jgi:hypothetical protein
MPVRKSTVSALIAFVITMPAYAQRDGGAAGAGGASASQGSTGGAAAGTSAASRSSREQANQIVSCPKCCGPMETGCSGTNYGASTAQRKLTGRTL